MQQDPLIRIRDLHVSFGSVEVLHGINLDIEQGVIHALIGESGSGKSVLARAFVQELCGTEERFSPFHFGIGGQ